MKFIIILSLFVSSCVTIPKNKTYHLTYIVPYNNFNVYHFKNGSNKIKIVDVEGSYTFDDTIVLNKIEK